MSVLDDTSEYLSGLPRRALIARVVVAIFSNCVLHFRRTCLVSGCLSVVLLKALTKSLFLDHLVYLHNVQVKFIY